MPVQDDPQLGINSWFEEELREQFQHNRSSVDDSWKHLFEANGTPPPANGTTKQVAIATRSVAPVAASSAVIEAGPGEELMPLRGAAARIAELVDAHAR